MLCFSISVIETGSGMGACVAWVGGAYETHFSELALVALALQRWTILGIEKRGRSG